MPFRAALAAAAALAVAGCGGAPDPPGMSDAEVAAELANMRIAPGLWELASEVRDVRGPDLPHEVRSRMIGPRGRMRHCITPMQAERPSANFLAARPASDCVYRGFAVRDGAIAGEMSCPDVAATMRGRYGPESYEMLMEMTSPVPGGASMTLEVRSYGRRVGECSEGDGE